MSQGNRSIIFLTIIIALLLLREVGHQFGLHHFQPYIALFFALSALKKGPWLLVPALAYLISTMVAVGGFQLWMLSPLFAFALIVGWGKFFSRKASAPLLLAGSLGGATIFYLVTNTVSWATSALYEKSFAGLAQALWLGLPGYPPTWTFFRNDAVATLLFTAFILVLNRMTLNSPAQQAVEVSA